MSPRVLSKRLIHNAITNEETLEDFEYEEKEFIPPPVGVNLDELKTKVAKITELEQRIKKLEEKS